MELLQPWSLKQKPLAKEILKKIFFYMMKSRILEERLILLQKQNRGPFWLGGPGEEAWGVPLGLFVDKGSGLKHDYLHLHYRATPTLISMGLSYADVFRLMMNRATDPFTGGRNTCAHYALKKWNVVPVTSPIEIQYVMATGTAYAQSMQATKSITIVTGGDAGTAEQDFERCLAIASNPQKPLPILITVQNNFFGVSTRYEDQHGESSITDRAESYGIPSLKIDGNDPIQSYFSIQKAIQYIRKYRRPFFIEAKVSRLYGHSSATGSHFVKEEEDCLKLFSEKLLKLDFLSEKEKKEKESRLFKHALEESERVLQEPSPEKSSIFHHIYQ